MPHAHTHARTHEQAGDIDQVIAAFEEAATSKGKGGGKNVSSVVEV